MRDRRTRSANHPIGSTPRTMNPAAADVMNTITPSLTPSDLPMSGPSTVIAADSSSSRLEISNSTKNMKAPPPRANPWRSDISASVEPGRVPVPQSAA
jgi:hypothetical protein